VRISTLIQKEFDNYNGSYNWKVHHVAKKLKEAAYRHRRSNVDQMETCISSYYYLYVFVIVPCVRL
jgi:hypothetical protein